MEDAAFRARLQRLDRDALYFQHLLQEAPQRERLEIRRQLLAVLQEKKATIQRQKEHTINQIAQKDLENARMAKAIEVLERMRNVQNWTPSLQENDRKYFHLTQINLKSIWQKKNSIN